MACKAQTLSLELSSEGFSKVTLAMMTHANESGKLQGFGQCLRSFLASNERGQLAFDHVVTALGLYESMSSRTTKIWVALSPPDLKKLRGFRELVEGRVGRPVSLAAAIYCLVDSFLRCTAAKNA